MAFSQSTFYSPSSNNAWTMNFDSDSFDRDDALDSLIEDALFDRDDVSGDMDDPAAILAAIESAL